jgi:hypothetical protein
MLFFVSNLIAIFNIIFGTFKNPKEFSSDIGFHDGRLTKVQEVLLFKDIAKMNH